MIHLLLLLVVRRLSLCTAPHADCGSRRIAADQILARMNDYMPVAPEDQP